MTQVRFRVGENQIGHSKPRGTAACATMYARETLLLFLRIILATEISNLSRYRRVTCTGAGAYSVAP